MTRYGAYNDPKYTAYKKAIALIAKTKFKQPSTSPISMQIEFFFSIPKSWTKKKKSEAKWHTSKPDSDNLAKGIKDALNGIIYVDDAQVCLLKVRKQYAESDGILVEIEEI